MATTILLLCMLMVLKLSGGSADLWKDLWRPMAKDKKSTLLGSEIVPESDLSNLNRRMWIITTACLPWMTGTSINPLLRAAYLAKERPLGKITLMVPWLEAADQDIAYPGNVRFTHPDEQRAYVKKWLAEEAKMPNAAEKLEILFYSARYHDEYHSIFPMGDITALIPDSEADVCLLEEPEHLNWYRAPFTAKAWTDKFKHVVGIIHTNYLVYTRAHQGGIVKEPLLKALNQVMGRVYCHKIIKLSGALQEFAAEKEIISNVHGVREKYLEIGDSAPMRSFNKGAYFVGKLAWPKGFVDLFPLMKFIQDRSGKVFHMDIYGSGPHADEIKEAAAKGQLPVTFHKATDHALLTDYKVFVNPSLSEVLCTTIVEALAMGKWVICPKHPSNQFFEQFPNCLTYRTPEEFAANVYWALDHEPKPLTPELRYTLSWEAANDRLLAASTITRDMQAKAKVFADKFAAWALETVGSGAYGDTVRQLAGGKTASGQIEYLKQYGSAHPIPIVQGGTVAGSGSVSGSDASATKGSAGDVAEAAVNPAI